MEIFDRVRKDWSEDATGPKYGNIIYLETGMGKTHIATMLLNYLYEGATYSTGELLVPHSEEDLQMRLQRPSQFTKKVFFIVPVQNLIE